MSLAKKVYIYLKDGEKPIWRVRAGAYWPIVDELSWIGVKTADAKAAADWSRKAKPGEKREVHTVINQDTGKQHTLILEAVEE